MVHWSENSHKLILNTIEINNFSTLDHIDKGDCAVYLFLLPFPRTNEDAKSSELFINKIRGFCEKLNEKSTICFITTPPDAAFILTNLEKYLSFKLWIAVKTSPDAYSNSKGILPKRHTALLVLTKYSGALNHTKTRIKYTYCPACNKTTKDYGGKKHTYHEYGTMISDVWRDIEVNPNENIDLVIDRVRDMFGIDIYKNLWLIDMRKIDKLQPVNHQVEKQEITIKGKILSDKSIKLQSKLLNKDCLSALKELPDNCIDFCFADPPYNLKKKYDQWDDSLESIEYFQWCDSWLSELHRVLKPGCTLAVLNIPIWAVRHYQYINSFMKFQDWIAWDALSFPVRMIMPAHYSILCFSKGTPRPLPGLLEKSNITNEEVFLNPLAEFYCIRSSCINKRNRLGNIDRCNISDLWYDIHRLKHNSRRVDHPCQLPPDLMRRLFALYTKPDEIILDCFNGSGTSTLVAQQMGRNFIGIELSQKYHELALERHAEIEQGINPFTKSNETPLAKNSNVPRLRKQKYIISKKQLQLEVKNIAKQIGHIPTKDEVKEMSEYSIKYFEEYFTSWGEVCAAARTTGMTEKPD